MKAFVIKATSLFILVLMLLPFSALRSSAVSNVTISGKVVDNEGDVLAGVWVKVLFEWTGNFMSEVVTDKDGAFTLSVQSGENYRISYSKNGYQGISDSRYVAAEDVNLGKIVMYPVTADVELSSPVTELSVKAGSRVKISFTVKNLEYSSVDVTFKLKAPSQSWATQIVDTSGNRVVSLALADARKTSSSASLDILIDVPMDATGYYALNLWIPQNSSATLGFTFFVESLKAEDLVYVISKKVEAKDDSTVQFDISLTNPSSLSMDVNLSMETPSGWKYSTILGSDPVTVLRMNPQGSVSLKAKISIPKSTTHGTYDLSFQASYGYYTVKMPLQITVVEESVENLIYAQYPELVSTPGSTVTFPLTLTNPYNSVQYTQVLIDAPKGWRVRVLSDTIQITSLTLKEKGSAQLKVEVTIPDDARDTTYIIPLNIKFGNITLSFPLKVTVSSGEEQLSTSDFVYISYPHLVSVPKESVKFNVKLTNPYDTLQYIDLDVNVPDGWTYIVKSGTSGVLGLSLAAKQSVNLELNVNVPSQAQEGTYIIMLAMKSDAINVTTPLKVTVSQTITSSESQIVFSTTNPYREAYGGRAVTYDLLVENNGDESELLDLTLSGLPKDFTDTFKDAKGQSISRIYVNNGSRTSFSLTVTPPDTATIGTVRINVTTTTSRGSVALPLTLEVIGQYSLSTQTQNLFTSVTIGSTGTFTITVKNDGTQDLNNVMVEISETALPDGLTITSTPTSVTVLRSGDEYTFTLTIKSTTDLSVGTYPIAFNFISDQVSSSQSILTVQASQESNILWIGIVVIIVGVVVLALVYRRFGRR